MSRKYKLYNKEGLYFVSFATVYWMDVFVRDEYFHTIIESLRFCRNEKGMEIYAFCIMPSHIHLIFRAKNLNPGDLLRDFKTFTSKKLQNQIEGNNQESRREWMLWMMEKAGKENSNVKNRQFWQQHNKPIELWSSEVIDQKLDYVHMNPVVSGFVFEAEHWKYSSAIDYSGNLSTHRFILVSMTNIKGLILVSILFCWSASFSQRTIQGKVFTKMDGEPISYVNIGILNSNFGTISNHDGSFYITIPSSHMDRNLIFSAIGYETKTIVIKDFATQQQVSIHLIEKITYLDEVVFTATKEKEKHSWLGNTKRHLMVQGQMYLDSISAGGAMALLIHKEDTDLQFIKRAMVFITKNTEPAFKVRVRFLKVDSLNNNLPGGDLINESIVITSDIRRGWLKFDLSPYTLSIKDESFYVAFEWILEDSDRLRIFSKLSEFKKSNPQKIHRDTVIIDGVETPIEDFSSRDPIPVIAFGDTRTKSDLENYLCYTRSNSFGEWERSTGIVSGKILMSNKPYTSSMTFSDTEETMYDFNYDESIDANISNWADAFLENYNLPGMQLSMTANKNKLFSDGFGYFDLENERRVTNQIRFRIASVSKPLTAFAMIKLASEGKLDLDADIRMYVPSFPVKEYSITSRQLAGHLGGIRDYHEISTDELLKNPHFENATEAISVFKNDTLMSKPGDQFLYSSFGYNLLGAAIEGASGQTYLDYMQDHIWEPLHMYDTYGDIKDSIMVNKSKFYYPNEEEAIPFDLSYNHPAGGLISTTDDLLRFGNELLNGNLIDVDFKQKLFQPQYTTDQKATDYGLGWYIGVDMNGHRIWYHAGEGPSTGALLILYPDDGIVISILTNSPILTSAPDGLPLEVLKLGEFLYLNR